MLILANVLMADPKHSTTGNTYITTYITDREVYILDIANNNVVLSLKHEDALALATTITNVIIPLQTQEIMVPTYNSNLDSDISTHLKIEVLKELLVELENKGE